MKLCIINVLSLDFLGDNLIQQSVSLLQVKDPLFKRMGASRLARFAIDGNFSYFLFFLFSALSTILSRDIYLSN